MDRDMAQARRPLRQAGMDANRAQALPHHRGAQPGPQDQLCVVRGAGRLDGPHPARNRRSATDGRGIRAPGDRPLLQGMHGSHPAPRPEPHDTGLPVRGLVARPLGRGREVLRRGLVQQLSPDRRGPGRAAGSGGVLPGDLRAGAEAALPHGMELPGAGQRPALRARRRDARGHADAEGPVLPLLPEHVVQPAVLRRFGLLHVRGRAGARNQQHVPRVQQLRPRQRARRALARADGHGRRTQSPGVRAAPGRQAGGRLRAGRQAGLAPSADACQKRLFDEIKRVRPLLPKVRVDYSREPLRGRAHSRHARWGH